MSKLASVLLFLCAESLGEHVVVTWKARLLYTFSVREAICYGALVTLFLNF